MECGSFPKLGYPYWGPYNKDYSILGSILGPPILGNYHVAAVQAMVRVSERQRLRKMQIEGWSFRMRHLAVRVSTNGRKITFAQGDLDSANLPEKAKFHFRATVT